MSTKFAEYKGLDLPKVAEEILDYWKENEVFEKSISTREGNEPYIFFEGTAFCKWSYQVFTT
jgi:isoleucyl-tRNA synthetase